MYLNVLEILCCRSPNRENNLDACSKLWDMCSSRFIFDKDVIPLFFPVTDIQRKVFFTTGIVSNIDKLWSTNEKIIFLMSSVMLGEVMTRPLEFSQRHIADLCYYVLFTNISKRSRSTSCFKRISPCWNSSCDKWWINRKVWCCRKLCHSSVSSRR